MTLFNHCPAGPNWTVDWSAIRAGFDWADALHDCPQDPGYHAEGDVGIHTEMALQSLASSPEFRALSERDRHVVFAAVLLHDVAKPMCTKLEGDRISSRGHSSRGDVMARKILWHMDIPFEMREQVCGLIRFHQVPFFLVNRDDATAFLYRVSQIARCDLLALVAWADGHGRRCAEPGDQQRILDNVELFREYCVEHDCLTGPRQFPSDHSRFQFFRKPGRDPNYLAHDDTRLEVTLLSGLPGAGKDHWLEKHGGGQPVISLDSLRVEMGIEPSATQGRVVDAGRALAREHLRAGTSFAWNATNLSLRIREQLVNLFADYNARVRIVYVETPEALLRQRNRARAEPVPDKVIDKLLGRWTVPSLVEAHDVSNILDRGALESSLLGDVSAFAGKER